MIFGTYPCCNGDLSIGVPSNAPGYVSENCPHCGEKVWHYLSRLDPKSWTDADFLASHDVDHEKKTIKPKTSEQTEQ